MTPLLARSHIVGSLVPGLCSCRECGCLVAGRVEPYLLLGRWHEALVYRDLVDRELRIVRDFWPERVPRQSFGPFNGETHLCLEIAPPSERSHTDGR